MLASLVRLCEDAMRLMGIGKLHALATSGDGAVARAAALLRAELASFEWNSSEEAAGDYPNARIVRHRIEIHLPDDHCAVVAVNYHAGIALVEYAGQCGSRDNPMNRKKRKLA
jgi:hypothetical protein